MRIVICCKDGLIHFILSEEPVKVLHLDADAPQSFEKDEMVICMADIDGNQVAADSGIFPVKVSPDQVAHYFSQVENRLLANNGMRDDP